jgi:hypothetical protein
MELRSSFSADESSNNPVCKSITSRPSSEAAFSSRDVRRIRLLHPATTSFAAAAKEKSVIVSIAIVYHNDRT